MLAKLDAAISKHAGGLLGRGFTATAHTEYPADDEAERTYTLDHVIVKAVYERGITYLAVGCASEPDRLVEASGFRDLLDPPAHGRSKMGMAAAEFLDAHWDQVHDLVRPSNWANTRRDIEARRRRR